MPKILDYDEDGEITINDLYMFILDIMKIESKKKIDGLDKKKNTLNTIRSALPIDTYNRYEPMLNKAIDFIYTISQNTNLLKHLKKNCKCLP